MTHTRMLLLLVAAIGIAGTVAWLLMDGGSPQKKKPHTIEVALADQESPDATADESSESVADGAVEDRAATAEALAAELAEETRRNIERKREEQRRQRGADAGEQGPIQTATSGNGDNVKRERAPTPAEREEMRREKHGRPALAARMQRTPSASRTAKSVSRSTKQQEWDESWSEEGINPPPMVPTPVQGKVMSEQAREGLASATVHLMTFFPINGVAGGPLLPVITDLQADEQGNFKGEVPVSPQAPLNFPLGAIGFSWQGRRVMAASQLKILEPGKDNGLGVFWAPELPYTLHCDATVHRGKLAVVSTGEINPQRLHVTKQIDFLASFPGADVIDLEAEKREGFPEPGHATYNGTWDARGMPYISLRDASRLLQTRRTEWRKVVNGKTPVARMPEPFETLVFTDEAHAPIGGQVLDATGAPISGAVLTTVGGEVAQSAISDFSGWFTIKEPHRKTTSLLVQHEDYVEAVAAAKPGDTDLAITLPTRRPRVRLHVTDKYTYAPITELSFKIVGIEPHGRRKGKHMHPEYATLASPDGHYVLEWDVEIRNFTLEKLGYFPRLFTNPTRLADQAGGELKVALSPGRNLEVRPADYTAAQDSSRWYKDANSGPGVYSPWSHHWLEYEMDFGAEPEEGEQGGFFDLVLGTTNHGIVDNEYKFTVDVYIDEQKKGTLVIQADSLTIREGRMRLGKLNGTHRIRLVWTNDKWIPEQLDANIRYATLKFIEQPR